MFMNDGQIYDNQMEPEIEDQYSQIQNEEQIIAQGIIKNFLCQDYDSSKILESIQQKINERFHSYQNQAVVEVLNVHFTKRVDSQQPIDLQKFANEPGFNEFMNNSFLEMLLKPTRLINRSQIQDDELVFDDEEENKENQTSEKQKLDQIAEFIDNLMSIYHELEKQKYNQEMNEKQTIFKLESLIPNNNNDPRFAMFYKPDIYSDIQNQDSKKYDDYCFNAFSEQLTVILKGKKQDILEIENLKIQIDNQNQPCYLHTKEAKIKLSGDHFKQFNAKLDKIQIKLQRLSFGCFDHQPEIGQQNELIVNFLHYFDTYILTNILLKGIPMTENRLQMNLFISKNFDSKFKNLEIFLELFDKYYLKIELDYKYCQYACVEQLSDREIIYIKTLTPPSFGISKFDKKKFDLPSFKEDWIKINNIMLEKAFEQSVIDEIGRLFLLNNTVIKFEFKKNELNFQRLLKRLEEMQLFADRQQIKIQQKIFLLNQLQYFNYNKLLSLSLSFMHKFSILCVMSENRLIIQQLNNLTTYILKQYEVELDHCKLEKIFEETFQQFIMCSNNLNSSKDLNINSGKNLKLFQKLFNKIKRAFIGSEKDNKNLKINFIRRVSITPSGFQYDMKMPEMSSKVMRQLIAKEDFFLRVHFQDENLSMLKLSPFITYIFIKKLVSKGIKILDRNYELLTWSASQLRAGSCWYVAIKEAGYQRDQLINSLGNFYGIVPVAKFAARLGQNFSSSIQYKFTTKITISTELDVESNFNKIYTDGIGKISDNLIQQMAISLNQTKLCAIQIRYGGAKGVLVQDSRLPKDSITLRKSMVKFQTKYDQEIEILDYNRFRGGYLNRQIIMLLMTLGIPTEPFLQLQKEHLEKIQNITLKDSSIYKYFNIDFNGEMIGIKSIVKIIQEMYNAEQDQNNNFFIRGIISRLKARGLLQLKKKANILVENAARLIGIIDEFGILKENEIYCSYQHDGDDQKIHNVCGVGPDQYVIVTRNPCIHPGDIQKPKAVTSEQIKERNNGINIFENYVNCVIFPMKGFPMTAQLAGGDLDGDLYFISWDKRLIPEKVQEPMVYDIPKQNDKTFKQRQKEKELREHTLYSQQELLDFLVIIRYLSYYYKLEYLNYEALGKIDNSHLAIADKEIDMANNEKCLQLAQLHSIAVDFVKTGEKVHIDQTLLAKEWPDFMEKKDKLLTYKSESTLGKLYQDICQEISGYQIQPIYQQGFECPGLPPVNLFFMNDFNKLFTLLSKQQGNVSGDNQVGKIIEQYQILLGQEFQNILIDFINSHFLDHIDLIIDLIDFIHYKFFGLCQIYNISSEYEIYSGNYGNLTRGEEIHKNTKYDTDQIQKRIIQHLVVLQDEINQKINGNQTQKYNRVSLLHLLLSYSPVEQKNSQVAQHLFEILMNGYNDKFQGLKKLNKWTNFCTTFTTWYRGVSWFFFSEILLDIRNQNQRMNHLLILNNQQQIHSADNSIDSNNSSQEKRQLQDEDIDL